MQEILIVDDERVIREGLKSVLAGEGFAVRAARDGEEALTWFSERRPDLVLLDVMMPKMNGFRVCEEFRRQDALVPVIFLTAKDSDADQVRGISLGADDYISKDVGEAVLVARIRRALERSTATSDAIRVKDGMVRLGKTSVDVRSLTVTVDGRETCRLTKTEAGILQLLDSERGRYFSIDELIAALRGEGFACEDSMIYSHVSHLRAKLGKAAMLIRQVRGAGYCLTK